MSVSTSNSSLSSIISDQWRSPYPTVYYDNAGRSFQPKSVEMAGIDGLKLKSTPWQGLPGSSSADVQELRVLYSKLINGGDGSNIALCPSTAFAISMIANNVSKNRLVKEGDSILVLEKEMGSVIYPWQDICNQTKCKLRVVPTPNWSSDTASWTANIINALDDSVSVVSIPNVHWCDGSLIDLVAISEELSRRFLPDRRPLFIVDATQSIGAIPIDVMAIDADAVACSVHKWLLSPYGTSLLYIHPRHHDTWSPLDQHERARLGSENSAWDEVIFMNDEGYFPSEFYAGARKLDAGGRPNPVWIPMIRNALHLIHEMSVPAIYDHLSNYCDILLYKLQACLSKKYKNIFTVAPRRQRGGHILGLHFADMALLQHIHNVLKQHNVFTSIRGGCLRISPYLSNTIADANLFQALFAQAIANYFEIQQAQQVSEVPVQTVRVLLTGACGWLAQSTFRRLLLASTDIFTANEDGWEQKEETVRLEIFGTYRESDNDQSSRKCPHWILQSHRINMDLSSKSSVTSVIEALKPDIILHLAACSSPVECHKDPERARLINAPAHLIDAVQHFVPNALFLFASTDMVYDGEHPPYSVASSAAHNTNTMDAVNIYGASKREMELLVSGLRYGVSLRLSNMIGVPYVYHPVGEKFLQFLYQQYQKGNIIGLKEDEIRSFVYVEDVIDVMVVIMHKWFKSRHSNSQITSSSEHFMESTILNVGGPEALSRLALASILSTVLQTSLIVASSVEEATALKEDLQAEQRETKFGKGDSWVVYRMVSPPSPTTAAVSSRIETTDTSTIWSSISSQPLRSPKDITMNSQDTEASLNLGFNILRDVLANCLHVT